MPPSEPHVNDPKVNMDCMPDAFGRRPMGCPHDGWSHPSPYASLSQMRDIPPNPHPDCNGSMYGCHS